MFKLSIFQSYLERMSGIVKVVSFDVFDTLLIRLVPSERVSQLAAIGLCRLLHGEGFRELSEKTILKSRNEFTHKIKRKSFCRDKEWTVSQWLEDLAQDQDLDTYLLKSLGRQAELDAECLSLRSNEDMIKAVIAVKRLGLGTIAISDMWLEQEWLIELLDQFELSFDEVFSSGSLGVSKRRGTMFRMIEKRLGLPSKAFIHVGNKFRNDYINPRLKGWKSIWVSRRHSIVKMNIPPKFRRGLLGPKTFEEIIQALEVPLAPKELSTYFRLAYDYLAPLLIIFSVVQWKKFNKDNVDIVFYVARDARLMLDVYDIVADHLPDSCQRRYVRLSRRSIALVHPDHLFQNVLPLPGKVGRKNVGEWLSNFVIDIDLRNNIFENAGLTEGSYFSDSERKSLRSACRRFLPEILDAQREQRSFVRDLLLQGNKDVLIRKIGIVDSGWAGTIQDTIRGVLNDVELVSGVYLGVSSQGHPPKSKSLKYGLLRDDFRNLKHHNPVEASAGVVRIWDTLLREPTETVVKLRRCHDGTVEPVLGEQKAIGHLEKSAAEAIRQGVREGTLARLKSAELLVYFSKQLPDSDFEIAATTIARKVTTRPSRKIARAILQMGFDEGTAGGSKGSVGINGILDGVAWYPGILASLGLGWSSPVLEAAARVLMSRRKRK